MSKLKLGALAGVLAAVVLVTGCGNTVLENKSSSLENKGFPGQLAMLKSSPNFKQTALDEIKYVTTFSSWADASKPLGLDLASCAEDDHSINYNMLPNYSILQTDYGVGSDTLDDRLSESILQTDGGLTEDALDFDPSDGILQSDRGLVGEAPADDRSNGVESVTVFFPNSKNGQNQNIDSTASVVKLSDRVSVDDSELYGYFNDFCSIASSKEVQ